ncbi:MAG: class I SAM-dependent methyltransferase [Myxococcota bacterium]
MEAKSTETPRAAAARGPSRGRLPTALAPCPACADDRPEETWPLPGQLLPHRQSFLAARCGCGQAYLREQVPAAAQARLYDADYPLHRGPALWGLFAPVVAFAESRVDARRVRALSRARTLGPGDRVLDLGCGRGSFLDRLHGATGASGLGLDHLAPANPRGTPWSAGEGAAVRCLEAALPALPEVASEQGPYAAITLWHALEHDPAPRETLAWVREHLAPDGVLLVEVPDESSGLARRFGGAWAGHHTPRHVSLFEPESLRQLLETSGFDVTHHRRAGTLLPWTLVALSLADRAGFRFGRHPAWALFPFWAAGLVLTAPWLARAGAEGRGLQLAVARRA